MNTFVKQCTVSIERLNFFIWDYWTNYFVVSAGGLYHILVWVFPNSELPEGDLGAVLCNAAAQQQHCGQFIFHNRTLRSELSFSAMLVLVICKSHGKQHQLYFLELNNSISDIAEKNLLWYKYTSPYPVWENVPELNSAHNTAGGVFNLNYYMLDYSTTSLQTTQPPFMFKLQSTCTLTCRVLNGQLQPLINKTPSPTHSLCFLCSPGALSPAQG